MSLGGRVQVVGWVGVFLKKIYQRTMTICVASFFEEILVMVIVFSFPETDFQRTMTICARRLS